DPSGRTVASASFDDTISLCEVATGKEVRIKGTQRDISSVAFAPDGKRLATGGRNGRVKLWDVTTLEQRADLKGHTGPVYSITFNRDGRVLASGGADGLVNLWDPTTGQALAKAGLVPGTPVGRSQVRLTGHTGPVYAVAFTRDGKILATGGKTSDEH